MTETHFNTHKKSTSDECIHATVGILTFNSGATLRRALESVKDFADIVLCDGGSTDDTLEIARAFGARVISQSSAFKNPNGTLKDFGGVRQQLLDAAKETQNEWFLYIDSDETISDGLREEIRRVTSQEQSVDSISTSSKETSPLVYRVPIGIMLGDAYIKHSTNYPGYQYRFFNIKSGAHFIKPVHERIVFDASISIGFLTHPWYVYSTKDDWNHYVRDTAGYRNIEIARYADQSWGTFLTTVFPKSLRTAVGTFAKALGIYLRYGSNSTLPVRGEFGRGMSPLILIAGVVSRKLGMHKK